MWPVETAASLVTRSSTTIEDPPIGTVILRCRSRFSPKTAACRTSASTTSSEAVTCERVTTAGTVPTRPCIGYSTPSSMLGGP
jgi:hypothetical protein